MGLDMYLTGDKFTPTHDGAKRAEVDGYDVESQRLALGYWRKHWALHNYIEEHHNPYSEGKVDLDSEVLRIIADAVEQGLLVDPDDGGDMPHYQDVYAYHREPEQVANTVKILRDAADWLDRDDGFWRSVEYHGSW
tara:strand:+ start:20 stop:427 length:408 start_codon:yes stop_codon:yes gene_type:complete